MIALTYKHLNPTWQIGRPALLFAHPPYFFDALHLLVRGPSAADRVIKIIALGIPSIGIPLLLLMASALTGL